MRHEFFMQLALAAARKAQSQGEVPIGAVIVRDSKILGVGWNRREQLKEPTSHAEIEAIRNAVKRWGDWRLYGSDIYVTLEPCLMCAGALLQARVRTVYFGAFDPKGGALGSLLDVSEVAGFNHKLVVRGGLLADRCSQILKDFFKTIR
ncbi:MAG: nucleoside deaminase [Firmicutes bacterium]|nr:nucleoside deaminase [Bacillota bacterium]